MSTDSVERRGTPANYELTRASVDFNVVSGRRLGRGSPRYRIAEPAGKRLAKARLEEGVAGVTRLHELVAQHNDDGNSEVVVGIETDRGPWVLALIAAGHQVFAINPLQIARYRERRTVS